MLEPAVPASMTLDATTVFVIATCVTALLGAFLLYVWSQDRVRALAWWGTAYLIGGFSVAIWSLEPLISPPLPAGTANALVFVACGMIWNAARMFHGRRVLWAWMLTGSMVWLVACLFGDFVHSATARIVLSSCIVATYTFLTAAELWRERRRHLLRRWPAIFVPMLHGAVFLCPIPLAGLLPADGGIVNLASGWIAIFALETMLYVVGTAFIVLVLSKERAVRIHKDAAAMDELTGLLNRRGFFTAAQQLIARQAKQQQPVSALMFDLDHFKSINDRFGHAVGDEALRVFADTLSASLRASDVVGRFGGEEFVALLPGNLADATVGAERVRVAFEQAGAKFAGHRIGATVSIGAASGAMVLDVATLLKAADAALYRAKDGGRNRVEGSELPNDPVPPYVPSDGADGVAWHVDGQPQGTPLPAA
jgi:diguanylate cyclase (GGDEF)-like protein